MQISVIILTYKRWKQLKVCLSSIIQSNIPKGFEIIFVINGKDPASERIIQKHTPKINKKIITTKPLSNGGARNLAINQAKGEILYFLDDDVIIDKNLFVNAIREFKKQNVPIIGGPNLTPRNNSLLQKCFGYILESWFGAFKMHERYIKLKKPKLADEKSLILCNLAIKRDILIKEKVYFDRDLVCNEENLLLQLLDKKGYKMMYSPNLIVYHDRRRNLVGVCKQFFKYGRGRAQNIKKLPSSFNPVFLSPSLFLIYIIILIITTLLNFNFLYLIPLIIYLLADLFFSTIDAVHKNPIILPIMFILYPCAHLSYGFGFLYGFME